jgi:hypothetical protein
LPNSLASGRQRVDRMTFNSASCALGRRICSFSSPIFLHAGSESRSFAVLSIQLFYGREEIFVD